MFKEATLMFLYAESSLHMGSGMTLGLVDLPIQREKHTQFPTAAGSGLKGAIREWFEQSLKQANGASKENGQSIIDTIFGPEGDAPAHAGALAFSDARVLLFPVRSMKGVFAYITCPMALSRLTRDFGLTTSNGSVDWTVPDVPGDRVYGSTQDQETGTRNCELVFAANENEQDEGQVVLEEYGFNFSTAEASKVNKIARWLAANALPNGDVYDYWRTKIKSSLLIMSDDNFTDFVQYSTEVNARVKLGEGKSTDTDKKGNLFYEENLPPETVLYTLTLASSPFHPDPPDQAKNAGSILDYVTDSLASRNVQIGGDETIGRGIVRISFLDKEEDMKNGK